MSKNKIPLAVKIIYSLFMLVMVPVYLVEYGPSNFLYFCDVALVLTLVGIWMESPILISMCAVGIIGVQFFWVLDFVVACFGKSPTGFTDYMFNEKTPLFLRSISLYHAWLPFLLAYLVVKTGYDRRAVGYWTLLAWVLIVFCFVYMPPPSPDAGLMPVNLNYVWGLRDDAAQTWMSSQAWVVLEMVGLPVVFYWPVHFLLKKKVRVQ